LERGVDVPPVFYGCLFLTVDTDTNGKNKSDVD